MRIAYLQYTNPGGYPPLEHSSQILADAGWDVLFLGTGAQSSDALTLRAHRGIRVRKLPFCSAGLRQKVHYVWFCMWVLWRVAVSRATWIYASDPLACIPALLLSAIPGMRVIYHEHDSPTHRRSAFLRAALWARRQLAGRAACCVLPNEARAQQFRTAHTTAKVLCVWNCPRLEEVGPPRSPINVGRVTLLYHGSINRERLPLSLIAALADLPVAVTLRIIGYETIGSCGYLNVVRARAREMGVSNRLEIVDAMPRVELMKECRRADIGLALMPVETGDLNMAAMTGASNKAFDYMCSGLPLIVSELPDWKRVFVDSGHAVSCIPGDSESIANAVRFLIDDLDQLRAMGERGRRQILTEWNYESQFAKVFDIMRARSAESGLPIGAVQSPPTHG
jgi:glycosyltransferase involved in cell wall biosynthesis